MFSIHFIVHSISSRKSRVLEKNIKILFSDRTKYNFFIKHSKHKGHAVELTKKSIKEKANVIVACGGDGTINEVARNVVFSSIIFGIVPMGSGNGLARYLNIPNNILEALKIIKEKSIKKIDVGKINDDYFFCNAGVSFDAFFMRNYNYYNQRGIIGYARAFLVSLFDFRYLETKIDGEGLNQTSKPFLLLISNTNLLGYNISISPNASIFDGKLDLIVVEKMSWLKIFLFFIMTLFRYYPKIFKIKRSKINYVTLHSQDKNFVYQIDGDFVAKKTDKLVVSVLEKGLNVIVSC